MKIIKQIKIIKQSLTKREKAFEELISITETKQLSNKKSEELLEEIRSGNGEAIEKLVNS